MSWYQILLQILAAVTADAIICCICLFIFFRCKKIIKDRQQRKRHIKQREIERKRALAHHEYEVQFRMALRILDLENKKVNKQTVILKGIYATPEGEKVIREYEKEGVQNGVHRVSKIED